MGLLPVKWSGSLPFCCTNLEFKSLGSRFEGSLPFCCTNLEFKSLGSRFEGSLPFCCTNLEFKSLGSRFEGSLPFCNTNLEFKLLGMKLGGVLPFFTIIISSSLDIPDAKRLLVPLPRREAKRPAVEVANLLAKGTMHSPTGNRARKRKRKRKACILAKLKLEVKPSSCTFKAMLNYGLLPPNQRISKSVQSRNQSRIFQSQRPRLCCLAGEATLLGFATVLAEQLLRASAVSTRHQFSEHHMQQNIQYIQYMKYMSCNTCS